MTLIALAAASPITPTERSIIVDAVKAEVSGGGPSFGPIPAGATIVCGRVNGSDFQATITRNAKGRIVEAGQVVVMTDDLPAVVRAVSFDLCIRQGYVL